MALLMVVRGMDLKIKIYKSSLQLAVKKKYYSGFDIYATLYDLLKPFQLTANLCQMNYMIPVWMYRADSVSEDTIREHGQQWVNMIDNSNRSSGRKFLDNQIDETAV